MQTASWLIPYRAGGDYRERNFKFCLERLRSFEIDGWSFEIIVGDDDGNDAFNRSYSINKAAKKATGGNFLIVDADAIFNKSLLTALLERINKFQWWIPHSGVDCLSKEASDRITSMPCGDEIHYNSSDVSYNVLSCSGLNAISRESFWEINGFDEGFVGWGYQDVAFHIACRTLLGPGSRVDEKILHLWHPVDGPAIQDKNPHWQESNSLMMRYIEADGKPDMLRELQKK